MGLFIPFIPTPPDYIAGFFELLSLSPNDVVYDLGSGDGRLLFAALDKGAGKAVGIELDPALVRTASETARSKHLKDKVTFRQCDVMKADLSEASVVFCYLCGQASTALKPKFEEELKPGTRVIMESFFVPGWKPVRTLEFNKKHFYLYIMPPERDDRYGYFYDDYTPIEVWNLGEL